jgi:hypothetical protein
MRPVIDLADTPSRRWVRDASASLPRQSVITSRVLPFRRKERVQFDKVRPAAGRVLLLYSREVDHCSYQQALLWLGHEPR